jgi:predicted ferric reductase
MVRRIHCVSSQTRHPFSIANTVELQTLEHGEYSKATPKLELLVGIHKGFTSRLQAKALASDPHVPFSLPLYVDGPYGHSPHTGDFDTVVLVAGGTGVTYMASVLEGIIWAANVMESNQWKVERANRKLGKTRKVVLIWSVRERREYFACTRAQLTM